MSFVFEAAIAKGPHRGVTVQPKARTCDGKSARRKSTADNSTEISLLANSSFFVLFSVCVLPSVAADIQKSAQMPSLWPLSGKEDQRTLPRLMINIFCRVNSQPSGNWLKAGFGSRTQAGQKTSGDVSECPVETLGRGGSGRNPLDRLGLRLRPADSRRRSVLSTESFSQRVRRPASSSTPATRSNFWHVDIQTAEILPRPGLQAPEWLLRPGRKLRASGYSGLSLIE